MPEQRKLSSLGSFCLLIAFVVAARAQTTQTIEKFPAVVLTVDNDEVAQKVVVIDGIGEFRTSDHGQFQFPPPTDSRVDEVVFHVPDWIVVRPCEGSNGRGFLPRNRRPIEILILARGDKRLTDFAKQEKLVRCIIVEANLQFKIVRSGAHVTHRPKYAEASSNGLFLDTAYSIMNMPTNRRGETNKSANLTLRNASTRQDNSSTIDHSEFLKRKSEELGIPHENLASAINSWIKTAEGSYNGGLAALYLGKYAEAEKLLSQSIGADGADDESTRYILLARAEYGLGNFKAAQSTLNKVLATHPRNAFALRDLDLVNRDIDDRSERPTPTGPCKTLDNAGAPCMLQEQHIRPPDQTIPKTLFGLHIHHADTTTPWPSVPFGTLRLWDCHVSWEELEPQRGKWNFAILDKLVSLAVQHGVEIEMPIDPPIFRPGSPAESKNMQDWRGYVETLATRYKGRINLWELWNEPNTEDYYTVQQMVELEKEAYEILKQVDPSNRLASPSGVGYDAIPWLQSFLAVGGGNYADAVGFHFYVTAHGPEEFVPMVQKVRRAMAEQGMAQKTIWDTETGWFIRSDTTEVKPQSSFLLELKQAAYLPRAYFLAWALGVTHLNWYDWDSTSSGLAVSDGNELKLPAMAYAQTQKWVVGARMTACDSDSSETWVCHITRNSGYSGYIIWNAKSNRDFSIPGSWGVQTERRLNGNLYNIKKPGIVAIGNAPILLETKAQ